MCMAGLEGGGDEARRDFAALRTLRDRLRAGCPAGGSPGRALDGHERRLRDCHRGRRDDRPRRLGLVRRSRSSVAHRMIISPPCSTFNPHPDGTILPVRAQPGRGGTRSAEYKMGCQGLRHPGTEKGKANKAIVEVLAKWLGVRKSQIELISGETASQKKFLVRAIEQEDSPNGSTQGWPRIGNRCRSFMELSATEK